MKRKHVTLAVFIGTLLGPAFLIQPAVTQAAPKKIEITAKRFTFEPAEITVEQGEPVVLELKSVDVTHGLRIRELHVDVKVNKGATTEASFTPTSVGDFVAHCSVFCGSGHGKMTFTVHVVKKP